jgi:hypothetical protein
MSLCERVTPLPPAQSPGVPQILSYPVLAESLLPIFINPDLQSGYGTSLLFVAVSYLCARTCVYVGASLTAAGSGWQMFLQNGYTVRWKGGNVDGYRV